MQCSRRCSQLRVTGPHRSPRDEQRGGDAKAPRTSRKPPPALRPLAARPRFLGSHREHVSEGRAVRVHASTLCPGSPACPLEGVARPQGLPQRPLLHRPQAAPAQMPSSRGPGGPGLPSPPGQKPRLPPFRSGARGSPTPRGTEGHQLRTAPGGTGGSGSWVSSPRVAPGGSGSGPALQGQSNGNLLGLFLGK